MGYLLTLSVLLVAACGHQDQAAPAKAAEPAQPITVNVLTDPNVASILCGETFIIKDKKVYWLAFSSGALVELQPGTYSVTPACWLGVRASTDYNTNLVSQCSWGCTTATPLTDMLPSH